MAFKVRLFAGDTVVEQLFFMPHDDPQWFPADGRLGLEYQPHGFATHIAPTTEDGQPVAVTYDYFDGELTLHAAHPWVFGDDPAGGLIPQGPGVQPTTDAPRRLGMNSDDGRLRAARRPGDGRVVRLGTVRDSRRVCGSWLPSLLPEIELRQGGGGGSATVVSIEFHAPDGALSGFRRCPSRGAV